MELVSPDIVNTRLRRNEGKNTETEARLRLDYDKTKTRRRLDHTKRKDEEKNMKERLGQDTYLPRQEDQDKTDIRLGQHK